MRKTTLLFTVPLLLASGGLVLGGLSLRRSGEALPVYTDPQAPGRISLELEGLPREERFESWHRELAAYETPHKRLSDLGRGLVSLGAGLAGATLFLCFVKGAPDRRRRPIIWGYWLILWLALFPLIVRFHLIRQERFDYPTWGDSIAIGIINEWSAYVIGFAVGSGLLSAAMTGRAMPGKISLRLPRGRADWARAILLGLWIALLLACVREAGLAGDEGMVFSCSGAVAVLLLVLSAERGRDGEEAAGMGSRDLPPKPSPPPLPPGGGRRVLPGLLLLAFAQAGAADRPNVLFIAADDLNTALGCYGHPQAKTPHLDRLAATGVCFERAYHQIPLCNPARASLMTGRRPDATGVYDLDRHFRETLPEAVTLPQRFAAAGYFTARVGKIYHYDVPAGIGTEGLDDAASWQFTVNPRGRDKDDESLVFNAEPHRKISAALSWLAAEGADEEQTDGRIASEAIRLMEESRDRPFFLGVGFFRPHTPFVAPKQYFDLHPLGEMRLPYAPLDDRSDIPVAAFAHNNPLPHYGLGEDTLLRALQAYHACVSFVDAQVGRLLDALDELDLARRTLVVFWSDHGYHLGEHGGVWQKRTLFEESARAPLLVRLPGAAGNGRVCRRVVEFVDLYPTLAEAAGLGVPEGLDGRSLLPLLRDPLAPWEGAAVTQILRPADERLGQPVMGRSLRTERWRYTEWNGGGAGVELYDHASDPLEFHNLAQDPDEATRKVIGRLRPLLESRARALPPDTPFEPSRL